MSCDAVGYSWTGWSQVPPRGAPVMSCGRCGCRSSSTSGSGRSERRGVPTSTLVREWIELELTALEDDQPISRADALRALAALRPMGAA